eukprot:gnl/MRDRNA2_/MRDRNA2_290810_c0_seq1.p1 gnl/MRDRNA2_/MRDRNA2_290810_c0~~gnl/MRDRNA2_/MRDRNA2_290810_c0_seq1.p1  ORF type:complete len:190 (+),score=50.61 gnl/MRDRNA2_/MRDRNA2_290810_c0_seq1:77-571(+)
MDDAKRAELLAKPRFTNTGNLKPGMEGIWLRARVQSFNEKSEDGCPVAKLGDASGRVTFVLKDKKQQDIIREVTKDGKQGSIIIGNVEVYLKDGYMRAWAPPEKGGKIEKNDGEFSFGFMNKDLSEKAYVADPEEKEPEENAGATTNGSSGGYAAPQVPPAPTR